MAQNKNALIRYKTIDKCLQNRYREWTLDDLIEACSDALYEYEGRDVNVSKRSIQLDIQLMRSDKLGYNAPIVVYNKKYYKYDDDNYSITNIPLTENDMSVLSETVEMLKQFKDFSLFSELGGIIQRLEDKVYTEKNKQPSIIHLDKNEHLKGLEHLDVLYQAILKELCLTLTYQSFKAREASDITFHPFILKEYNNRWFVVGKRKAKEPILTLALDRIHKIEYNLDVPYINQKFEAEEYFKNTIGVSVVHNHPPEEIILFVTHRHAPYVLTKPLHHSQKLIERDQFGVIISLNVHHNFELERAILGFGDGMKVIEPQRLRRNIKERLQGGIDLYDTELNEKGLITHVRKLTHNGFSILNNVYTNREIKKIKSSIDKFFEQSEEEAFGKRKLLMDIPNLSELLLNKNLKQVVSAIDKNAFLVKAIYFDKPPKSNWYVTWHQDVPINVSDKKNLEGYTAWTHKHGINSVIPPEEISKNIFTIRIHLDDTTKSNGALKVVPGSHNKRLSDDEVKTITNNCTPYICEVAAGGIQLMKPLLLHSSSKSTNQKRRRVIHLEFTSQELPSEIEWLERLNLS